jgi:hypothetical protein
MTRREFGIALYVAALGGGALGAQSDEISSHKGGEATIVTGSGKDTVQVRSTRFR